MSGRRLATSLPFGLALAIALPSSSSNPDTTPHHIHRLPTRIALLDPFFTMTPKAYLGWRTLPAVLTEEVEELKDEARIVFETYKTSILSHAAANALRPHSAFFEVNLPHVPWWKLRSRHVAAPYIYFMYVCEPSLPLPSFTTMQCNPPLINHPLPHPLHSGPSPSPRSGGISAAMTLARTSSSSRSSATRPRRRVTRS